MLSVGTSFGPEFGGCTTGGREGFCVVGAGAVGADAAGADDDGVDGFAVPGFGNGCGVCASSSNATATGNIIAIIGVRGRSSIRDLTVAAYRCT